VDVGNGVLLFYNRQTVRQWAYYHVGMQSGFHFSGDVKVGTTDWRRLWRYAEMAQIPHLSSENIFFIRRQRKGREKALSKIQLGTFEEEEKEEEEGDLLHIRMK
jgi:ADP-ribose pyrophosphatase YjhB (NUDIX family)